MTTHESDAAPSRRVVRRGDEQDARVVTMLRELAPALDVEPDAEYRRAARQRLVAMAAVRTPEPVRPSPLRRLLAARAVDAPAGRWRTRATAGMAGAALTVTSLATLVALAAGAGPGDVLYGVKRGTEQTQLALAGDSRGQALLDLARTRLEELDDLDGDAGLVRSTLATMDDQTTEGASWYLARAVDTTDPAPLDTLSRWAGDQSAQLAAVRAELPAEATDDVAGSQGLLDAITERAAAWQVALDCPGGAQQAGADSLGPLAVPCRGGDPAPQTPPVPAAPGAPAPEVTPPQVGPGVPPVDPTAPSGPAGQPPSVLPPPSSAVPAPVVPPGGGLDLPGPLPDLPIPNLPLPEVPSSDLQLPRLPLPAPAPPAVPTAPPATGSEPVLKLPLPVPCVELPPLVRTGTC